MVLRLDWVLLACRLPREPSTPRITARRKLRRLGVAQLVDGLVALPVDAVFDGLYEYRRRALLLGREPG